MRLLRNCSIAIPPGGHPRSRGRHLDAVGATIGSRSKSSTSRLTLERYAIGPVCALPAPVVGGRGPRGAFALHARARSHRIRSDWNRWRAESVPATMYIPIGVLFLAALVGCTAPVPSPASAIQVTAVAGPTCPVVSDPPDPDCDDRLVEGAEIVVQDEAGAQVARITTDADGTATVNLPPGRYVLVPQPVEGLMGTAPSVSVILVSGVDAEPVVIAYDTGIR